MKTGFRRPTLRAQELRANPTEAERRLWRRLSARQCGDAKFSRQMPIGPYICDFLCRDLMLVIEVDGGQHAENERDAVRTRYLETLGYRVNRFWNNDVLSNTDGVVSTIFDVVRQPVPTPNPSRKREGSIKREPSSSPPARAGGVDSPQASGGGPVAFDEDSPSPSTLRSSSPPAPAGGAK